MTIELSERDLDHVLVVISYAIGSALKEGDRKMAWSFIRIANRVGEALPGYQPYEILLEKDHAPTA